MLHVLHEGPWSFENASLVCRQVCAGLLPGSIVLDSLDMWVQLHDVPMGYTSGVILEQIDNYLGSFIQLDDRFCLKAREAAVPVELYPYDASLRAGGSRGPCPVGDRWLLPAEGPTQQEFTPEVEPVCARETEPIVVAVSKRWREGSSGGGRRVGGGNGDVTMADVPKNLQQAVREVIDLVSSKKPDFVFLMETKVRRAHAKRLRIKLGFEGLFYVEGVGLSGGLVLFWKKNNTARLISFSKNHVDVEVSLAGFGVWRMTGFYGFPERNRRSESWDLLRSLATRSTLPWVVLGDFNDLLFQHEKRGGNPHPEALLRGFGEAIDDCQLSQLPMHGYRFTWERGKGTANWMEERLDKVLAGADWCDCLPHARVTNLLTRSSDHSALFLNVQADQVRHRSFRRSFKFEMAWLQDEGCREQVEGACQEATNGGLLGCLRHFGAKLSRWGGDRFHRFGEKIKNLRKEQLLIRDSREPVSLEEFHRLELEICRLEAQEDAFWKQRAKQHWLRGADANTRFFHRYASARKKKNTLTKLRNESDEWVEGDGLNSLVLSYFKDIFASNNLDPVDSFTASVLPRVSVSQNETLLRPFEADEVKAALYSMFPDKALGPDGMNPGFFQHFWELVGADVTSFVIKCLNDCSFPSGLNDTNVVLIPKKSHPEKVSDLRPIAVCNVVYKIMAKMIANRMKPLLGDIISESQSVFIPGRLITDNILIAAEVGHFLNRKQGGVVGWGALKLDMAKAYDRMEWPYLRGMLLALGFAPEWVNLIMLCVTTVSYSFQVNEGWSLLLQKAEQQGLIHGCRVARGAPPISHLFFADDSLLFFKANVHEAGVIKQCLTEYEALSGQAVNFNKSSVCFSRNTSRDDREGVVSVLGVEQAPNFGKYLGLPAFVGRNKKAVFAYVEDKLNQRVGT
ncbi:uncharacterized protein LOC116020030 [Ipomoea triloba]|uniref:uncharacterized protein LOC116020030 n=1 Tax=Ipomoea triloba TaxID=35885 RepID=UPI00125DA5EF|nr:uncharacterized protein LOC116020030 [Ipomoea triloba]